MGGTIACSDTVYNEWIQVVFSPINSVTPYTSPELNTATSIRLVPPFNVYLAFLILGDIKGVVSNELK